MDWMMWEVESVRIIVGVRSMAMLCSMASIMNFARYWSAGKDSGWG